MPPRLSDLEIQRALGSLPGWARRGDVLTKSFTFKRFSDGIDFVQRSGNELKLVFPQAENDPAQFEGLTFEHFFLQPMDGPDQATNIERAVRYCMEHPQWRLSLQTHKIVGIA